MQPSGAIFDRPNMAALAPSLAPATVNPSPEFEIGGVDGRDAQSLRSSQTYKISKFRHSEERFCPIFRSWWNFAMAMKNRTVLTVRKWTKRGRETRNNKHAAVAGRSRNRQPPFKCLRCLGILESFFSRFRGRNSREFGNFGEFWRAGKLAMRVRIFLGGKFGDERDRCKHCDSIDWTLGVPELMAKCFFFFQVSWRLRGMEGFWKDCFDFCFDVGLNFDLFRFFLEHEIGHFFSFFCFKFCFSLFI